LRRALLLLLGLGLFGLLVAAASSVSTNDEDIATFSTQTSLTVPMEILGPAIYITGDGTLETSPPANHNTTTKRIGLHTDSLETQSNPQRYVTFESAAAPTGGFVIQGYVKLLIDQDEAGTNRMTAGLLDCPASEPNASTGCTTIALAVADVHPDGGNGFKERTVRFGFVNYTVAAGREFRLKIVNREQQPPGTPVSAVTWRLSFGYNPARPSQLLISATP
jgi:hypothetical protein